MGEETGSVIASRLRDGRAHPVEQGWAADEIDRLARERAAALESVLALSSWQRRAVNAIGALRDELDPDDTDPIWSPLFDLLAEEFGDDANEDDDHG